MAKDYSKNAGFHLRYTCTAPCGGDIVVYSAIAAGIDADGHWVVMHEPSSIHVAVQTLREAESAAQDAATKPESVFGCEIPLPEPPPVFIVSKSHLLALCILSRNDLRTTTLTRIRDRVTDLQIDLREVAAVVNTPERAAKLRAAAEAMQAAIDALVE